MRSAPHDHATESLAGADGVCLAATRTGHGPTVLLLHGGGQTRHSWNRTSIRLAEAGLTALAMDLRGHGDSDWDVGGRYEINDYRRDLDAVIAALGPVAAVVGASLGGATSLMALGNASSGGADTAGSLILVDVTPRMELAGVDRIRAFMSSAPDGFASLEEAADAVSRYRPEADRRPSAQGLAKNLRRGPDGRFRWHWDPRIMDGFHADERLRHEILVSAARGVRVPTLLVRGAESDVVGDEGRRELAALIPTVRYAEVEAAGHMVVGDNNDTFSDSIVGFVREHVTVAG